MWLNRFVLTASNMIMELERLRNQLEEKKRGKNTPSGRVSPLEFVHLDERIEKVNGVVKSGRIGIATDGGQPSCIN